MSEHLEAYYFCMGSSHPTYSERRYFEVKDFVNALAACPICGTLNYPYHQVGIFELI